MNLILNTDSYKASHWLQYPPGTEYIYSYIESRGSSGDENTWNSALLPVPMKETVFFGLQAFIKENLLKPITMLDIEEAHAVFTKHGVPFNIDGWLYIFKEYGGYLPLEIKAVPEGMVIPVKNALVTVENTDPKTYWLPSYIETALLRAIWYPTTTATISWRIKNLLRNYWQKTSDADESSLDFKLHDFGARGVSSRESAGIGGGSHLINFKGTDTVEALCWLNKFYKPEEFPGYSIPAAEHSSITTWGKDREVDSYRNMLRQFTGHGNYPMVAIVSDSYDIDNATKNIWGKELRQEVINSGSVIIIRPDSGDPTSTVLTVLDNLAQTYGTKINTKGYRVLNHIRVIQGDGIDERSIRSILNAMDINGYSIDNVAFGMGGALLQHSNRDTFKFAMKASSAIINGKEIDVFKDPITDIGKHSKKGRVVSYRSLVTKKIQTARDNVVGNGIMNTIYKNGVLLKEYTLEEVRENSKK